MVVRERNYNVDLIRSLAIFLMVIFHFLYDLRFFGWVNWNVPNGEGWREFRYVILTLFFICVGLGLFYSHSKQVNWRSFSTRLGKLAISAAIITVMSLVMFPHKWVYFGVLHFIFVASICAIGFVRYPKLALIVGVAIILFGAFADLHKRWPINYLSDDLPRYTTDFVPLFPWLGVILLGITLGHSQLLNNDIFKLKQVKNTRLMQQLAWPGKHSLVIYLVHQPILFALLAPIHWLMN